MSEFRNNYHDPTEKSRPNYALRRVMAGLALLGCWQMGETVVGTVRAVGEAIEQKPVATGTAFVEPGSNLIKTVCDGADRVAKEAGLNPADFYGCVDAALTSAKKYNVNGVTLPGTEVSFMLTRPDCSQNPLLTNVPSCQGEVVVISPLE